MNGGASRPARWSSQVELAAGFRHRREGYGLASCREPLRFPTIFRLRGCRARRL